MVVVGFTSCAVACPEIYDAIFRAKEEQASFMREAMFRVDLFYPPLLALNLIRKFSSGNPRLLTS